MSRLKEYILSDLYRYRGKTTLIVFAKTYLNDFLFRLMVWNRIAKHLTDTKVIVFAFLARRKYKRICRKCGVEIPLTVKIGFGCKINHGYGLVVNSKTIIGNNVTLMHNLTFSDEKGKAPVVGNRVRFTPGAVIVGDVKIGDDSVIGANCVVTKDVPENDIAVGVPNRNLGKKYIEPTNRYYWETK